MTVRWGLIGCGDISRKRVAPALAKGSHCELIAVSRATAALAADFAREFGARRWYADWREMLQDDEIDAVYIATPVHLHAEQTVAAANTGKHVLCEKPMALTVSECDGMINSCERNQVSLGIAYYRHFYPSINRIKEIIGSGEIGSPILAELHAFERFDPAPGADRYWLMEPEKAGGGPMMDFGCHRIEILINVFGEVQATTGAMSNALYKRAVEDTAVAILGFAGGTQAIVSVSHAVFAPRDTLDIHGSLGSIHVPILNAGILHIRSAAGERTEELRPNANLHLPLIEDFAEAVLEGRLPGVGGDTGRAVADAIANIYRRP
ncbi:MAG: Gfo/Idh/MocA family oxidoreductase [Acidobacteriota bacterium]